MLKHLLLGLVIMMAMVGPHAEVKGREVGPRDLDALLQNDINERLQRINEMTIHLNASLAELKKVDEELNRALAVEEKTRGPRIVLRNASAAAAVVSFVGVVLYQTKGVNPSKIILAGGYGLAALVGIFSAMENKAIRLTHEEVVNLKASVADLQNKIEIEKRNLAREIRLLCLERGGSPSECED